MTSSTVNTDHTPLAERMRPQTLEQFVGQAHLLGPGKILWQLTRQKKLPSLLLWGPPGCGKTTLARILARDSGAVFIFFSAVLAGVKEIREIVEQARKDRQASGAQTVLFVDEIHRFNKSQQDAFLPHVESGLLTLIGATTENPSFQVIAPLLSRCRVLVLQPLSVGGTETDPHRGHPRPRTGLRSNSISRSAMRPLNHIAAIADGDARNALTSLEIAVSLGQPDGTTRPDHHRPGNGNGGPAAPYAAL